MKKLTMIVVLMLTVATMATMSEAAQITLNNLTPVYSPDSDTYPYIPPPGDESLLNTFSSVWLGKQPTATDTTTDYNNLATQPIGIYGVGTILPSAGDGGYNLYFDYHLRTFDTAPFDQFGVVITAGDYIWNGATVIGGWTWGGTIIDGLLEINDTGPRITVFVDVDGASTYYLNVVLATTTDTTLASWGRFSDVTVEPIPEPGMMMLVGSGLVGLAGWGRRRFKK